MAEGGQPSQGTDVVQAALAAVSKSLTRRGYLTTEWWTTIIGGALSAVLALVHVKGSSAAQVVAIAAPAVLAALYAIVRTMHKSSLASALGDAFPQAAGGAPAVTPAAQAVQQPAVGPADAAPAATVPITAPVAQTSPDFVFQGIPPIEESAS